jgi:phosphopantetheine--protein transferase-like protein
MIVGIGIDSIATERFAHWHNYTTSQLLRIFSAEEVAYCLSHTKHSAERFAVRFATREALFKALTMYKPNHTVPFLTLCKLVCIKKDYRNAPQLAINWHIFEQQFGIKPVETLFSLTHIQTTSTAR